VACAPQSALESLLAAATGPSGNTGFNAADQFSTSSIAAIRLAGQGVPRTGTFGMDDGLAWNTVTHSTGNIEMKSSASRALPRFRRRPRVDGVPVCAIQEERLSRHKGDAAFPLLAIESCLQTCGGVVMN